MYISFSSIELKENCVQKIELSNTENKKKKYTSFICDLLEQYFISICKVNINVDYAFFLNKYINFSLPDTHDYESAKKVVDKLIKFKKIIIKYNDFLV